MLSRFTSTENIGYKELLSDYAVKQSACYKYVNTKC